VASSRVKRVVLVVALVASFVGCFPLAIRIADPFFTRQFREEKQYPILLAWPDHVEMRRVQDISEVSPRPKGTGYAFNVEPDRQAWVESKVRNSPSPNGNAVWIVHVKPLSPSRQQIQLDYSETASRASSMRRDLKKLWRSDQEQVGRRELS
jgi:hypothetical protein